VAAARIPANLRTGVGRTPDGAAWLERLPALITRSAHRWRLTLGRPFLDGTAAWTAPVRDDAGRAAVLKISFPHDEARAEAAVLRAWGGRGAPALLADHPGDWALLLERVVPGTPLSAWDSAADERLRAGAAVASALRAAPDDVEVPSMRVVCARWADVLEERGRRHRTDPGLVAVAADLLRTLPTTGPADVVHGDLNPGNILRSGDGRWLAIDPKPLRGDPAYDPWPLLEQVDDPFEHPDPWAVLAPRVRLVADLLGLDADRVAAWGLARAMESALWIGDRLGDGPDLAAAIDRARVWGRLAP
jgi:streptomycin 6-kinase